MMDWKGIIKTVAPVIGTALGTPMSGAAVKFIADQFLGDKENPTQHDVESFVLGANPETLAQIRAADNEFKSQMARINVDVFKLEVQDRDSARQNHKDSKIPGALTIALTVMVASSAYVLFYEEMVLNNKEILLMLFGALMKAWGDSIAYWFGTTRGSSDKNKLINPLGR